MRFQDPSTKWLAGIAVVVVVRIVISVGIALLNRQGDATLLAEDTPEGTVQRSLMDIEEGDVKAAYRYLGSELQETCTYAHFRDSSRWFEMDNVRAALQAVELVDGQAEV